MTCKRMKLDFELIVNFVVAMLAIVNPVEKIPLWVEASEGGQKGFQWRLAGLIILSSALILLLFLLMGKQIMGLLQLNLASFKIGGGLILLQFGFSMLKGAAVELEKEDINRTGTLNRRVLQRYQQVFIPIGVPVIAGPGAITTVIIYGSQSGEFQTKLFLSIALIGVLAILYLTLLSGPYIQKLTGQLPLKLSSRVFGMILIAIAVQFMVEGLVEVFPGWVNE
ncbi:MAG: MarC family protein [Thermodesulfobacteriota bacterium]